MRIPTYLKNSSLILVDHLFIPCEILVEAISSGVYAAYVNAKKANIIPINESSIQVASSYYSSSIFLLIFLLDF
jgi:hypothetical protein